MTKAEKRKPLPCKGNGLPDIEWLGGAFDTQEDSRNLVELQACKLRQRFTMSWPRARLAAELHFGRAVR